MNAPSTNPFAAALAADNAYDENSGAGPTQGQQTYGNITAAAQQQQAASHHPNNPFASASASNTAHVRQQSASPTTSNSQQFSPTNPFHASQSFSTNDFNTPQTMTASNNDATQGFGNSAYVQSSAHQPQEPASSSFKQQASYQPQAANDITASLSGLDFGSGVTSSPNVASPFAYSSPPAVEEPRVASPVTSDVARSLGQQQQQSPPPEVAQPLYGKAQDTAASPPSAASANVYAPPPGPPPGHTAGPPLSESNEADAVGRVQQMESDEAYARRVWERDAERQRRHAERRGLQGAGASAAEPVQQTNPDRGKRRQYSRDYPDYGTNGAVTGLSPLPPTGQPTNINGNSNSNSNDINEEKQWNTKEVYWRRRSQRIVVQNENGPCSLIALCNVLLLRGDVTITPEDRPAVSYSYLASLLGEHLIDVISSNPNAALDLEAALSILPQTQYGLDVNVKFSSIDGFVVEDTAQTSTAPEDDLIQLQDQGSSSAGAAGGSSSAAGAAAPTTQNEKAAAQRGELALFKLCNVPLVHGWLADQSDTDTWAAVVERAGDYDRALDRVVAADELSRGFIEQGKVDESNDGGAVIPSAAALAGLSPDDARVVNDAMLIRRFLESTATQLTYPGLYALSTTLQRGSLYALFRNSHLSVLYRPTEEELMQAANAAATEVHNQPQLYQLVTDATLENEDGIVWESVEDVDGSASRFYDGKFRPARVQEDFVGARRGDARGADEDADFAYAQHLQQQERMRVDRHRHAMHERRSRQQQQQQQNQLFGSSFRGDGSGGGSGGNGLIARMLAKRKANKRAPDSNDGLQQQVNRTMGGSSVAADDVRGGNAERTGAAAAAVSSPPLVSFDDNASPSTPSGGAAGTSGDKKWWKKVF